VRYLIVGGYAAIVHSEPRYTKDLALWIVPTAPNAERLLPALGQFGAPTGAATATCGQPRDRRDAAKLAKPPR
jgi:hypothetical protein